MIVRCDGVPIDPVDDPAPSPTTAAAQGALRGDSECSLPATQMDIGAGRPFPTPKADSRPSLTHHRVRTVPTTVQPVPDFFSVPEAARRLGLTDEALRARCRRAARRVNGHIEAHIGAGVIGVKLGRAWRIIFPAL